MNKDTDASPGIDLRTAKHLAGLLLTTPQDETPTVDTDPAGGDGKSDPDDEGVNHADGSVDAPPGYRLIRRIGEGASGVVWLAYRAGSDRPVALKLMKRVLGDGKSAQRAWRELDLLAQIRSPRLPALLDYGTHRGRLYIATEQIDGFPIDRYFETTRAGLRERVALLAKVADAAGELHEKGVIHRDLKPSNILVTGAGEPVLIDLGIATLLTPDALQTLTEDGAPIGTPAYMAPEQARGERSAVGVRSEVYALGAVCFRLLTGQTPHDLEDATLFEAVRRVGSTPARDPRELDPALPKPLAAVLARACSMLPKDRYPSAAALAADLRRWLNREPVEAQPAGPWIRATRWMSRHPIATTAAVCIGMLATSATASAAFIRYVAFEPFDVWVSDARKVAWIQSRTGANLSKLFDLSGTETRGYVYKVERPEEYGGRWVAVVSCPSGESNRPEMMFFDPWHADEPEWTAPPIGPYPPLDYPSYSDESRTAHHYLANKIVVGDIFPQRPGREVALFSFGRPFFPSCLRVFGTDGEQLYRAWVPGQMSVIFLENPGVFVLAGPNNRLMSPHWEGRSREADDRPANFAQSVMTLRPVLGKLDDEWITYGIPGSSTNAERCWVFVQPSTHGDETERDVVDGTTLTIRLAQNPTFGSDADSFLIELFAERIGVTAEPGRVTINWTTNTLLEPLSPPIMSDGFQAQPELVEYFERCRFEASPPFDPNPP